MGKYTWLDDALKGMTFEARVDYYRTVSKRYEELSEKIVKVKDDGKGSRDLLIDEFEACKEVRNRIAVYVMDNLILS